MKSDLHLHTLCSDGVLSARQVVRLCRERELHALSVTDHDTLDALPEAKEAAGDEGLLLIPGVEISTVQAASAHVLGYGVPMDNKQLNVLLSKYKALKLGRMRAILDKLRMLSVPVSENELAADSLENLGRPHVARAMVIKGYVASSAEAFEKYLANGRPAYVPRARADTKEAIRALRAAGAVPVLAHPGQIKLDREELLAALSRWKDEGLCGIEAYHPSHSEAECAFWDKTARDMRLLVTGGSDFHEPDPSDNKHAMPGDMLSLWTRCHSDLDSLLQRLDTAR